MSFFKTFLGTEKSHNAYNIVRDRTISGLDTYYLAQYNQSNYWKNNIQKYIQNTYELITIQPTTLSCINTFQNIDFPKEYFSVSNKKIVANDISDFKSLISLQNIISYTPITISTLVVNSVEYNNTNSVFYTGSTPTAIFLPEISSFLFFNTASLGEIDEIKFQYSFPIHEFEYICNIAPGQMNLTTNLTAYEFVQWSPETKSGWYLRDNFTNSFVSSIGLYNNEDQLLALAKVSSPIKVSNVITTTIIVQFDYTA